MKHLAEKFDKQYFKDAQGVNVGNLDLKDDSPDHDDENLKSDFNVDVQDGETVLLIYVKNSNDKDMNVTIKVDTTSTNMKVPICPVEDTQTKN